MNCEISMAEAELTSASAAVPAEMKDFMVSVIAERRNPCREKWQSKLDGSTDFAAVPQRIGRKF